MYQTFFVINTNYSDPKALARVELNGIGFYTSLAILAGVVLEVLLYCPDLRVGDDGMEPPLMEDVVQPPITVIGVLHEPSIVVSEPPLVVPDSIFVFAKETMGEHDDIAQSLGSMGVREETEKSIDDRIPVFPLCTLHSTPFLGNALYVCLNKPFT